MSHMVSSPGVGSNRAEVVVKGNTFLLIVNISLGLAICEGRFGEVSPRVTLLLPCRTGCCDNAPMADIANKGVLGLQTID